MEQRRQAWLTLLLVFLGPLGCGRGPVTGPASSGAREKADSYFRALTERDWPQAYACLNPQSQGRCAPERFALVAEKYRRNLGFEPEEARITACEEQGDRAIAHVAFKGKRGRYKDAVALERHDSEWGVVLPAAFGGR